MKKNLCLFFCGFIMLALSGACYGQLQVISTIAGNSSVAPGYSGDGGAASASLLNHPASVATDAAGNIYVADFANHVVRKISTSGIITTFAGNGTAGYTGDGAAATAAMLSGPTGLATDVAGNLYIADAVGNVIRRVSATGVISTFAGTGSGGYSGDLGAATAAQISSAYGVATDNLGNVYIADYGNEVIRKVTAGIITTIAGTAGSGGYTGDGGAATAALLNTPTDVIADALGNIYIADNGNHVVRKINALGTISTIAGNGTSGSFGNGVAATTAELSNPYGVAVDGAGNVYVADQNNNLIRKINTAGIISNFAGSGAFGTGGDGGLSTNALLASPTDVAVDGAGHTYIADFNANAIRLLTPDNPPGFIYGNTQHLAICQDASTISIDTMLSAIDSDVAQREIWSVNQMPTHGALTGFNDTLTSTGDTLMPVGLHYTPDGGYSGLDSFKVSLTDGIAITTTTVIVTVNATPVLLPVTSQAVCNNAVVPEIDFVGFVGGTVFNWTSTDTSIGLADTGSGNIDSFMARNITSMQRIDTIVVTPTANGCTGAPQTFMITVNPTPMLSVVGPATNICDSTVFNYMLTSPTPGTTFAWSRNAEPGISNVTASGGNPINEILIDTTTAPVTVLYVDTLTANGCMNTQEMMVTVNPRPVLTSTLAPSSICDSTTFTYVPASATTGATFTWSRSGVAGIMNSAASGVDTINETLVNTTADPVGVTYIDTIFINGCSNTQAISFTVFPKPVLSSMVGPFAICDSTLFMYEPASATSGVTYMWSRSFDLGIGNTPATGTDTISEYLDNIVANPSVATYTYTLTANGCSNMQDIMVTVNPTPMLSSPMVASVCDSTLFSYTFASGTAGTTYSWTRAAVTGISDTAVSDTGNINEVLVNTTPNPITVSYVVTLSANSCTNMQTVNVTVNSRPVLSSTLTPAAICDSTLFTYIPTSSSDGVVLTWVRPFILGIGDTAAAGTDTASEYLYNFTANPITVTYVYTLNENGCMNTQDVTVAVNPKPVLNSDLARLAVCNGSPFKYTPTSATTGTAFTWTRAAVTNITPATGSGTDTIYETLDNNTTGTINVVYVYTLTANGCSNTEDVDVAVNPSAPVPTISVKTPSSVCDLTYFQNFGASVPPPAGITYSWSAENAAISDTGSTMQYALVNFKTPGQAVVLLTTMAASTGCKGTVMDTVNVGTTDADAPAVVTYFNHSFVCLQNDEEAYQWGYDDASTLAPTVLAGQINQDYVDSTPDNVNNKYWVMVTHNGCTQKSYYEKPANATMKVAATDISVYPNPAHDNVTVEVNTTETGNITVELVNMVGQKVATAALTDNKVQVSMAQLPTGIYLLNTYRDGIKLTTTRVIKN